jgi:hypothetical protein
MVQSYLQNRRKHYGPDIARKRHDDGGRPASDPVQLGQPESTAQALWDQSEDGPEMEEAHQRRGLAHGSAHPALDGSQRRR